MAEVDLTNATNVNLSITFNVTGVENSLDSDAIVLQYYNAGWQDLAVWLSDDLVKTDLGLTKFILSSPQKAIPIGAIGAKGIYPVRAIGRRTGTALGAVVATAIKVVLKWL
ncbi:MAG: hypothetical protein ACPG8A_03340 [Psychrobium sp.]